MSASEQEYSQFMELTGLWMDLFELANAIYSKAVSCFNWRKADEKSVYKYLIKFLDLWGKVRTALRINAERLAKAIRELNDELDKLEGKKLTTVNLDEFEDDIKLAFDKVRSVKYVGSTSASKILHIINPELFAMWEDGIRREYNVKKGSDGYLKFMKKVQEQLRTFLKFYARKHRLNKDRAEKELCDKRGGKSFAKLIDEYNWLRTRPYLRDLKSLRDC